MSYQHLLRHNLHLTDYRTGIRRLLLDALLNLGAGVGPCRWASLSRSFLMSLPAWAAEKMRLRVDDYQIDAELIPHTHKITARAKVKFTALEDLNIATFELHNALRVTKVTRCGGQAAERRARDPGLDRSRAAGHACAKDSFDHATFEYEGMLDSADDSPVQGLKLAYIGDDTSYLLYAGRWFPVNAYGINRFTATMNITVPAHMMVIGSGKRSVRAALPRQEAAGRRVAHQDLHLHLGQAQLSRAPSWPASFRNSRATKPDSTCTSSSSRPIRAWERRTPPPRSRNSPTT